MRLNPFARKAKFPTFRPGYDRSKWERLSASIARKLFLSSTSGHPPANQLPIKVVCISDTHNTTPAIPEGDLLVHSGDLTDEGTAQELQAAIDWIDSLPHKYKVVIAGNHDRLLDSTLDGSGSESSRKALNWRGVIYLENSEACLSFDDGRDIKVYGSPWTKYCGNWAFSYPASEDIWQNMLPADLDILLTHSPPAFHLDSNLGCKHLLRELKRAKPRLHVFGHIHEGHGTQHMTFDSQQQSYENVMERGQIFKNLFLLIMRFAIHRAKRRHPKCTLVNAAMIAKKPEESHTATIIII